MQAPRFELDDLVHFYRDRDAQRGIATGIIRTEPVLGAFEYSYAVTLLNGSAVQRLESELWPTVPSVPMCPVCLEPFDYDNRYPCALECGHVCCIICVTQLAHLGPLECQYHCGRSFCFYPIRQHDFSRCGDCYNHLDPNMAVYKRYAGYQPILIRTRTFNFICEFCAEVRGIRDRDFQVFVDFEQF